MDSGPMENLLFYSQLLANNKGMKDVSGCTLTVGINMLMRWGTWTDMGNVAVPGRDIQHYVPGQGQ